MLGVISIRSCTPAGFKLTKLFGIDDFSAAKDFGKVFIIIIYCFYNYNYYYYYLKVLLDNYTKSNEHIDSIKVARDILANHYAFM